MPSRAARSSGKAKCWSPSLPNPKARRRRECRKIKSRIRTARSVHQRRRPGSRQEGRDAPPRPAAKSSPSASRATNDDEDEFVAKEIERLLKESKYVVEGYYGIDAITHCCLEPHGSTVEWKDGKLTAHLSTQNVSGTDDEFAKDLKITADDVTVHCDYIGGGFGSKFAADYWGIAAAKISKAHGPAREIHAPRDQELKIAGNRPSGYHQSAARAPTKTAWSRSGIRSTGERGGPTGGGVSHGADSLCDRAQELSPRGHRHQDQHGSGAGLAGSESSAGLRPVADGAG